MPTWIAGVLAVAAIYGVVWLVETLKEKAQKRSGVAARVADASDRVGYGVSWFIVKAVGVFFLLLAAGCAYLLVVGGLDLYGLLGLLLFGGYAIYLLAPGEEKWVFFWTV